VHYCFEQRAECPTWNTSVEAALAKPDHVSDFVDFQTAPSHYRHWKLSIEGRVATLAMNVQEGAGIRPGCKLKLNSYDLGVDIELHDALQRIRFEHPEVASVGISSAKPRIFCSGANIYTLGLSSHAWKVNFCKFTNETRNGIEDFQHALGPEVCRRVQRVHRGRWL